MAFERTNIRIAFGWLKAVVIEPFADAPASYEDAKPVGPMPPKPRPSDLRERYFPETIYQGRNLGTR
jgi:hypothetical protein